MDGKQIAMGAGAALVGLVALAVVGPLVVLPREATVSRSLLIDAPACNVHAVVTNIALFNSFSPWAEIDPAGTTYTYDGPKEGVGAKISWQSAHENVGTGSMVVDASEPCKSAALSMDFGPNGVAGATWTFEPEGTGTKATWGFKSDMGNNPIGRVVGTMMDGMLGPDYEKGLANLKRVVEAMPKDDIAGLVVTPVEVAARPAVLVKATSAKDVAAVGTALGQAYGAANAFAAGQSFVQDGAPEAIYVDKGETWEITAVLPVKPGPVDPNAPAPAPVEGAATTLAMLGEAPSGKVLQATHIGSYATLEATEKKVVAWMAVHNVKPAGTPWEEYVSDPGTTAEDKIETRIYFPYAP